MSIFIGLGPVTHKIRFFLKFVYVQLAHMLGQIHTLDVYKNFIIIFLCKNIYKIHMWLSAHLLLYNTICTIFKGVLFLYPNYNNYICTFLCTNIGFRYGKLTRAKPDDVGLSRADNPASGLPFHAGRHNPGIRPSKNLPSYLKSNEKWKL
jgi:hypothetical protein